VATIDSNHNGLIFPNLTRDRMVNGPNQVWVADITYIAIAIGFVYLAAIWMLGRTGWSDMLSAGRWMHVWPLRR
jgi:hypothetical protein